MKNTKLWIVLVAIVVLGGSIAVERSRVADDTKLPPPDATLAGPQEPLPESTYAVKPPLSKNKITFKNNMKIEVITEGAGVQIENGQTAVVSYVGKLENGTVFDASKNHGDGSFSFPLGAGQVIKGWDQGVLGMKVGESRILTIPSDLAYGPNGIPGVIPPNATLIFEVSLLAIK